MTQAVKLNCCSDTFIQRFKMASFLAHAPPCEKLLCLCNPITVSLVIVLLWQHFMRAFLWQDLLFNASTNSWVSEVLSHLSKVKLTPSTSFVTRFFSENVSVSKPFSISPWNITVNRIQPNFDQNAHNHCRDPSHCSEMTRDNQRSLCGWEAHVLPSFDMVTVGQTWGEMRAGSVAGGSF